MEANANATKTEAELQQEVATLFREVGARTYTRHLVDAELAQLNGRLHAATIELHNRRQARAAIEAEKAAADVAVMDDAAKASEVKP